MEIQMVVEARLRLSAQSAFLGRIHPEIRLIKVKNQGSEIVIWVVVSHEPTEKTREDVSIAAAEIVADFPEVEKIKECFEVSNLPLKREDILAEGWIYQRAE